MPEKEKIFDSHLKFSGFFSLADFYKFCYEWFDEEEGLDVAEKKYEEKLKGNEKDIKIEWECTKKLTDYFKIEIKVEYEILKLKEVEIQEADRKIKTNQGDIKLKVKGTLIRDYDGKFEQDAWRKFLRGIYEKWIIPARVEQFEDKLFGDCDKFLEQAKAWLALEGRH